MTTSSNITQNIIDKAVSIVKNTTDGNLISRVIWIPPQTACSDPIGALCVIKGEK